MLIRSAKLRSGARNVIASGCRAHATNWWCGGASKPTLIFLVPRRCPLDCKCPRKSMRARKCPEEKQTMKNRRGATCQEGLEGALKGSLFLIRTLLSACRPLLSLCGRVT
ncbi:hypothetical protein RF11_14373 [Thelohanellus kitauei]|uniref:Uncharacterized protein n=1 Tax=Thelohanellus kitauei TaxID=669202 RepID=A0A0C2NCD9_THEKT|nr:hypothetical protein RF11_14373 [Thelohanellus kitauei]